MKPQFKPTSIDNLATSLCNSLQNIINLPQQQADIKQYIVTLNTPSPGQSGISEDNYKNIYKLFDFTVYLNGVNRAINRNCEWKWNDKIKTSIINNYSKYNNPISDFMDYIVNKGCNDLKQALNVLATNNYIPSIKDKLDIEDDVINKFFNEDTNDLANKFAYLIDFVYNKEKDAKNYKSQKNKDDLQCNLDTIKTEIENAVKKAQQQKISRENVNDLYTALKDKLNDDLKNVYDIKDTTNKQPITDFSKVQHKFEYHSAEISDKNAEPGNPLNNINHPMRYLLEDLEKRRNLDSNNLGTNAPCKVTVTEGTNGWEEEYNKIKYKMGDGSKVLIENGCSADEITGNFNQAGNGTQMNITHPKDKVISALSFQASINATVESMQNKFGDPDNPNDPVKFALKLNSQSYATCHTMFKELANYARAQYAQQATPPTQLPKEQIDYNKRFEHFNDIFINGVKLDRDFFTNSANYKNNNQFDEGMFVDAVWKRIEDTLQAKQQASNANGNTQVQLTEQEQILQNIVLQRRAIRQP